MSVDDDDENSAHVNPVREGGLQDIPPHVVDQVFNQENQGLDQHGDYVEEGGPLRIENMYKLPNIPNHAAINVPPIPMYALDQNGLPGNNLIPIDYVPERIIPSFNNPGHSVNPPVVPTSDNLNEMTLNLVNERSVNQLLEANNPHVNESVPGMREADFLIRTGAFHAQRYREKQIAGGPWMAALMCPDSNPIRGPINRRKARTHLSSFTRDKSVANQIWPEEEQTVEVVKKHLDLVDESTRRSLFQRCLFTLYNILYGRSKTQCNSQGPLSNLDKGAWRRPPRTNRKPGIFYRIVNKRQPYPSLKQMNSFAIHRDDVFFRRYWFHPPFLRNDKCDPTGPLLNRTLSMFARDFELIECLERGRFIDEGDVYGAFCSSSLGLVNVKVFTNKDHLWAKNRDYKISRAYTKLSYYILDCPSPCNIGNFEALAYGPSYFINLQQVIDFHRRGPKDQRPSNWLLLHLIQNISMALLHMSYENLVFLNLKPKNIIWDHLDECFKIKDFSLCLCNNTFDKDDPYSLAQRQPAFHDDLIGYEAPEVSKWKSLLRRSVQEIVADPRIHTWRPAPSSDDFGFGCILFELICRKKFVQPSLIAPYGRKYLDADKELTKKKPLYDGKDMYHFMSDEEPFQNSEPFSKYDRPNYNPRDSDDDDGKWQLIAVQNTEIENDVEMETGEAPDSMVNKSTSSKSSDEEEELKNFKYEEISIDLYEDEKDPRAHLVTPDERMNIYLFENEDLFSELKHYLKRLLSIDPADRPRADKYYGYTTLKRSVLDNCPTEFDMLMFPTKALRLQIQPTSNYKGYVPSDQDLMEEIMKILTLEKMKPTTRDRNVKNLYLMFMHTEDAIRAQKLLSYTKILNQDLCPLFYPTEMFNEDIFL